MSGADLVDGAAVIDAVDRMALGEKIVHTGVVDPLQYLTVHDSIVVEVHDPDDAELAALADRVAGQAVGNLPLDLLISHDATYEDWTYPVPWTADHTYQAGLVLTNLAVTSHMIAEAFNGTNPVFEEDPNHPGVTKYTGPAWPK